MKKFLTIIAVLCTIAPAHAKIVTAIACATASEPSRVVKFLLDTDHTGYIAYQDTEYDKRNLKRITYTNDNRMISITQIAEYGTAVYAISEKSKNGFGFIAMRNESYVEWNVVCNINPVTDPR